MHFARTRALWLSIGGRSGWEFRHNIRYNGSHDVPQTLTFDFNQPQFHTAFVGLKMKFTFTDLNGWSRLFYASKSLKTLETELLVETRSQSKTASAMSGCVAPHLRCVADFSNLPDHHHHRWHTPVHQYFSTEVRETGQRFPSHAEGNHSAPILKPNKHLNQCFHIHWFVCH